VVQIQIEYHSGVPVYRQIMDQISFHIASGLLSEGMSLPSVRDLSRQLDVNPMTISKALGYLEQDGLVARKPGRPLVICKRTDKEQEFSKKEHLVNVLRPARRLANQLGYSKEEAFEIFEEVFEGEEK